MTAASVNLFFKLEETIQILEDLVEVVKEQGQMIQVLNGRILAETNPRLGSQHYSIDDYYDHSFGDSLDSPLEDPLDEIEDMMAEIHIDGVDEMLE